MEFYVVEENPPLVRAFKHRVSYSFYPGSEFSQITNLLIFVFSNARDMITNKFFLAPANFCYRF